MNTLVKLRTNTAKVAIVVVWLVIASIVFEYAFSTTFLIKPTIQEREAARAAHGIIIFVSLLHAMYSVLFFIAKQRWWIASTALLVPLLAATFQFIGDPGNSNALYIYLLGIVLFTILALSTGVVYSIKRNKTTE